MKILIWIACLLASGIIQVIIKDNGVRLGAIPSMIVFTITCLSATKLCKKWDNYQTVKVIKKTTGKNTSNLLTETIDTEIDENDQSNDDTMQQELHIEQFIDTPTPGKANKKAATVKCAVV